MAKGTKGQTPEQENPELENTAPEITEPEGAAPEGTEPETKENQEPEGAAPEITEPEAPETTDGAGDEEKRRAPEDEIPNPCVYCGPSVKGVAAQYTTFYGGLPDAVSDFLRERPEAAGLFTTPEKFEGMRRRLETYGTAEAALYRRVKEAMNRGNPV